MAVFIDKYATNKDANPTKNDQKILDYLKNDSLGYYDSQISEDSNYQVWYQLSSLRTGLISWYPFDKASSVLEIGAGFGALTGMLCDKAGKVCVTERSFLRAKAISERWADKDNLTVYAGEWSDMDFDEKYDYIIITGVLERVGAGTNRIQVYADYVKKVSGLLKENGAMLIAVENRYGLKYFCGAVEPHTNRAFDGIQKYPNGTKGYSFSRNEMSEIVKKSGMKYHRFYYPLPDYKFPQLIYSDEYLPDKNLKERLIPYYLRKDTLIADERGIYDDVVENGVFPFFANSFLVECKSEQTESDKVVYSAVSTDRGLEKAFTTSILSNNKVLKKSIFNEGKVSEDALYNNISDLKAHDIPVVEHVKIIDGGIELPFIEYPTLSNVIKNVIIEDTDRFESLVERIYQNILSSSEHISEDGDSYESVYLKDGLSGKHGPILKKAYMELIPLNCFYNEQTDELLYFDQEFVREKYPAKYVLFRAIHYIYCFTPNAEQYYPKQKLIEKYEMQDTWDIYLNEEKAFLDDVRNHKKYAQFYRWAYPDNKRLQDNPGRLEAEAEVIAKYKVPDKMKKIWKVELQILDEIDRICKKYELTYFLVHGSLLGAVRHGGFIPWDDDLDVAMPRKDYESFLKYAGNELKAPLSIELSRNQEELYWGPIAKIRNSMTTGIQANDLEKVGNQGIWVDILPMDVSPEDDELFNKKSRLVTKCHRLLRYKLFLKDDKANKYVPYKDEISWIERLLLKLEARLSSKKKLFDNLDNAMQLYNDMQSNDVAFFSGYNKHKPLPAKDFASTVLMDFADRKIPVPVGYEEYLFITLGKDYMKYPPEEQRKPKHRGIMDPDVPYTEYKKLLCDMLGDVKGKQIILFGSGLMFEDYMQKYGDKYKPAFLVDNDENKWGRSRFGIEIKEPSAILDVPENKRIVVICSFYYREIIPQLQKMGINDYKVYVQKVEWILETENKIVN